MSGLQMGAAAGVRDTLGSELVLPLQGGSFGRGTDLRGGCDAELVIFLNAPSPTQPYRRPKSASSEQSGICCVIIHFLHTRSLLINTILPSHISWQGPAESEHFE